MVPIQHHPSCRRSQSKYLISMLDEHFSLRQDQHERGAEQNDLSPEQLVEKEVSAIGSCNSHEDLQSSCSLLSAWCCLDAASTICFRQSEWRQSLERYCDSVILGSIVLYASPVIFVLSSTLMMLGLVSRV
jgi:hypothetical protein